MSFHRHLIKKSLFSCILIISLDGDKFFDLISHLKFILMENFSAEEK